MSYSFGRRVRAWPNVFVGDLYEEELTLTTGDRTYFISPAEIEVVAPISTGSERVDHLNRIFHLNLVQTLFHLCWKLFLHHLHNKEQFYPISYRSMVRLLLNHVYQ